MRPLFFIRGSLGEAFDQGELLVPNILFSFFCFVRNNVEFSSINIYVKYLYHCTVTDFVFIDDVLLYSECLIHSSNLM